MKRRLEQEAARRRAFSTIVPTPEQPPCHDHQRRTSGVATDFRLTQKKFISKDKKRAGSNKSKIPKILETLHSDVKDVQMLGLNSERRTDVDFVVGERGLSQVYHGHSKNQLSTRNERHLPDIKLDKYSVRTNEFLKVDDDPRSGRFLPFNQFPKHLTKANMHQTKILAHLAGGGE